MTKPVFTDDEEQLPLLTEKELRDACLHNAATIVIAFVLGCEFEGCRLDDDGRQWPVSISIVEIKYPESWRGAEAFPAIAMIHEAGAMAVAKKHGRAPHRVRNTDEEDLLHSSLVWDASRTTGEKGYAAHVQNPAFMNATRTSRTAAFLDVPLIWKAVEALAQFIEEDGIDGCYGALGTDAFEVGDDSAALTLIKSMGLTPGWTWNDGRIARPKPRIAP